MMGRMLARRASERGERGVAMVEFALVATFLLLVLFGIIDFGNTFSDYQNLRQGVRESAREATSNPSQFEITTGCDTTCASTKFYNFIVKSTGLDSSRLTVTWAPSGTISGGSTFQVCVNYGVQSITGYAKPFLPSTVHSNVQMRMEPTDVTAFPAPSSPAATSGVSPCN